MNNIKHFFAELKERHLSAERIVAALLSSIMLSYVLQLLKNGSFGSLNDYYNSISFAAFYIFAAGVFVLLTGLTFLLRLKALIPWALMVVTLAVSALFAVNYRGENAVYFAAGIGLIDLIVVLWQVKDDKLELKKLTVSGSTVPAVDGDLRFSDLAEIPRLYELHLRLRHLFTDV